MNGTYVPEPEQAETVRLIFQMYSSGEVGLQKIVAELYRLGRLDAGGHVSLGRFQGESGPAQCNI